MELDGRNCYEHASRAKTEKWKPFRPPLKDFGSRAALLTASHWDRRGIWAQFWLFRWFELILIWIIIQMRAWTMDRCFAFIGWKCHLIEFKSLCVGYLSIARKMIYNFGFWFGMIGSNAWSQISKNVSSALLEPVSLVVLGDFQLENII